MDVILLFVLFVPHDLAFFWTLTILLYIINPAVLYWIPISLYILLYPGFTIWTSIYCITTMNEKKCCVPHCNRTQDNTVLHTFPHPVKDFERFTTWVNAIGGEITSMDPQSVFSKRRICHYHFESRYHTWSKRLSPNAVPTVNLAGFKIFPTRQPMQDLTNMVTIEVERMETSQENAVLESTPSTSAELAPTTATFQGDNIKGSFQAKTIALGNEIRKLQKSKESTMNKLKKALKLSKNPSFLKALKKFTTAAAIFTMLQFRESGKHKMGRRFKNNEKIMALAMYKQGPRAYRWLRNFFVLPAPLTLSRMISSASLKPGLNENLFDQLAKVTKKMNAHEKLCILLFDEIALTAHFSYNKRSDIISGFVDTGLQRKNQIADHALVFMLKGVHKNYKQPLAYSFCASTTPKADLVILIKNMIRKLNEIGFKVIGTVCDQGATNVSAINWLIDETKQKYMRKNKIFKNRIFEVDGEEVIPLYDPPHLIKGIRNNLMNKNLKYSIGGKEKTAKWDHIIQLYNENPAFRGIRLMPKLTERHVLPQKINKMKVKFATQLLSQTVGLQMGYLASTGILPKECEDTADAIIFFDKLFDSFNGSYKKTKKKAGKYLLQPVTKNSKHHEVWSRSKITLKSMKFECKNKLSSIPSITNWIQTIENIEYLVEQLSKKYSLTSLWMRHFNQDPLENFFSCIRSHAYRNNSPSCAGFETAFSSLLINNLSSLHSPGANCEMDSFKVFKSLSKIFFQKPLMLNCTIDIDLEDLNDTLYVGLEDKLSNPKIKIQLEYVTGYVLRKLKRKIFKSCEICNACFYNKNTADSTISIREYFTNKKLLTYPSIHLIKCFSNIQDITIHILRKNCIKMCIKQYIRTICSVTIDYSFINCDKNKVHIIGEMENVCLNLFIFNWCKDTNKLLNGSRSDFDFKDNIQKLSFDYFKKRRYK